MCKSLALSLPDSRTSYSCLKRELLAQADSRSDATVLQVFWEHRKPKGRIWREEAASLTKLARRCAVSDNPEQIRQIFVMEQLMQQLPKSIQMYNYVRERKPSSLDQLLDLILTYFRAHHLDETTWEPKENFTPMKNVSKPMTLHAHSGANVSTKTTTPAKTESSNPSGGDPARSSRDSQSHTNGAQTYRYPRKDIKDIQCHNCKQMGITPGSV